MRNKLAFLWLLLSLSSCDCGDDTPPEGADIRFSDVVFEECSNGVDDDQNGLTDCQDVQCHTDAQCRFVPANPEESAPPLGPATVSSFWESVRFLVEGTVPIVRNVDISRLNTSNVSVVRARILDRDGEPLGGIRAVIAGQPQYGYTFSREDGFVDFVVNAETRVVVRFDDLQIVPVDVDFPSTPRNDYATGRVVVATVLDPVTTVVSPDVPVLSDASVVVDEDGSRKLRVFFNKGTLANAVLSDARRARLDSFTLRATEYTVGASGPAAMPGLLPPTTDYTYAVELSIDELRDKSVQTVEFDRPVYLYLDNFLSFPTGSLVPSGFYDRERQHSWIASENGRVIEVVNGGFDITGNGAASAEQLAQIGMSAEEGRAILANYSPGQTLWRVPVTHFTPYDLNWPTAFPDDAQPLDPDEIPDFPPRPAEEPCKEPGSTIECESQTMTKMVPLPGTNMSLWYRSDRVAGRGRKMVARITLESVPSSLKRVEARLRVAGATFTQTFDPLPNQSWEFEWDGKDAYGREVNQEVGVELEVAYVYDVEYIIPPEEELSFGVPVAEVERMRNARAERELTTHFRGKMGAFDAKSTFALGGWMLDSSVFFDGDDQTLYLPNRAHRPFVQDSSRIIEAFFSWMQDGEPRLISKILAAPDGSVYIFTNQLFYSLTQIFRLLPEGRVEFVSGNITEETGFRTCIFGGADCGVGGAPEDFRFMGSPTIDKNGNIYFAWNECIRRFDPVAMQYENWAGRCTDSDDEEFPNFDFPVACGSSVYVTSNRMGIWRFDGPNPRGVLVAGFDETTILDNDDYDPSVIDGGDAVGTLLGELISPACAGGQLFWIDEQGSIIRLVDGKLDVYWARTGNDETSTRPYFLSSAQTGGPYVRAVVGSLYVIYKAEENQLFPIAGTSLEEYIALSRAEQDRRLDASSIAASDAVFFSLFGVEELPNGDLIVLDQDDDAQAQLIGNRFRLIKDALPGLSDAGARIIDPSGRNLLVFDRTGQFTSSLDARTSDLNFEVIMDSEGRVQTIRRFDGLETRVERNASGEPTAIIGFFGARTEFETNADGYLSTLKYPNGDSHVFAYDDAGLLVEHVDPAAARSEYAYDARGGLSRVDHPDGSWKTFRRMDNTVVMNTSSGREVVFGRSEQTTGRSLRDEAGLEWSKVTQDGTEVTYRPDGSVISVKSKDDPRFGAQARYTGEHTIEQPSGLTQRFEVTREVELSSPADLLSVIRTRDIFEKNGKKWTTEYDAESRVITRTSPEGRIQTLRLDAQGRVIRAQQGGFEPAEFTYGQGVMTSVKVGMLETSAEYLNGYVTRVTPKDSAPLNLTRDANGRLTRQQQGDVEWSYSLNGHGLPESISHTSEWMSFDWDGLGRMAKSRFSDGAEASYAYSETGQMTQATQASEGPVNFEYDQAQRVIRAQDSTREQRWTYDPQTGHIATIETPGVSYAYTYDGTLRTGVVMRVGAETMTLSKEYNNDFGIKSTTVDGSRVNYAFDDDELLTSVGPVDITWDATAPIMNAMAIGDIQMSHEYDSYGRVTRTVWSGPGSFEFEETMTFDSQANITSHTAAGRTRDYIYDETSQLREVVELGTTVAAYTYDDAGNRVSGPLGAQTYDSSGRLESVGQTSYVFDDAGRMESKGAISVVYDGFNRLIEANTPAGTLTYVYDSAGNRVGRALNGTFTDLWIYDNGYRPIAHKNPVTGVVTHFIYALNQHVPQAIVRGQTRYALITDYLGSVRYVVNASTGDVVQEMDFDTWGNVVSDTNPGFQPFAFAGGMLDLDTGLMWMGTREYDPQSGRFTSIDPTGLAGGENFWLYTGNNPTSRIDPHGEFWIKVAIVVAVGVLGGALYAGEVKDTANGAGKSARTVGKKLGSHNGPEDALRHCTMNCRLTRRHGLPTARLASAYHEQDWIPTQINGGGKTNTPDNPERIMDEFNNVCGQRIAKESPKTSCLHECEKALLNGELQTLNVNSWDTAGGGTTEWEAWKADGPRSSATFELY